MRDRSFRTRSLWTTQIVLAALFLFTGGSKLVMPADVLVGTSAAPAAFYRFIGICEILGALGLVLPGAFNIRRNLTPIAAGALVIVMSGAVGMTLQSLGVSPAILPGAAGILSGLVAYARRDWLADGSPVREVRANVGVAAPASRL